jgi:hypothetical protein
MAAFDLAEVGGHRGVGLFVAVAITLCSVLGVAATWNAADVLLVCRRT